MNYSWIILAAVGFSVAAVFFCSLAEASLNAVPLSFIRHEAERGAREAALLLRFKNEMGRPIAALLILNTLAATTSAAISGWAVGEMFGSEWLAVFSVLFTLVLLYASEILPKIVGVLYCRSVARVVARPVSLLVLLFAPLIWFSERLSGRIRRGADRPGLSQQEFLSMAAIGTEEGALDRFESSVIANVVGLDRLLVKDVLTPRVVVFRLQESTKLSDAAAKIADCNHTRIPLFSESDADYLSGYVTQRDIYRQLLAGAEQKSLREMARPIKTVPELMRVDKLLLEMIEEHEHICAVVDEHGGLAGIITLEDILEKIVGKEIVDEYDSVSDLRASAKILWFAKRRQKE
jgi:CBS domain containing-hemolysin-like protein